MSLLRTLHDAFGQADALIETLVQGTTGLRQRVRGNSLFYIHELLQAVEPAHVTPTVLEQTQQMLRTYIDLYLDFAILEARSHQKLHALEGIRLIRERKRPVSPL